MSNGESSTALIAKISFEVVEISIVERADGNERRYEVLLEPSAGPSELAGIICRNPAVQCVVGSRAALARMDGAWEKPGFYVLFEEIRAEGNYGAYVGQASSLKNRLSQHRLEKDYWKSAVAIQSAGVEFNENHISYLETQMHSILRNAHFCERVHNEQATRFLACSSGEREWLDDVLEVVVRISRTLGYEMLETEDLSASMEKVLPRRKVGISLRDLFDRGLLVDGDLLTSSSRKWPCQAIFRSPNQIVIGDNAFVDVSPAAEFVTGSSMNGWRFWIRERGEEKMPIHVLRAQVDLAAVPPAN